MCLCKSNNSVLSTVICTIKYTDITPLELKLIALLKLNNSEQATYLLTLQQLRAWAKNIKKECPNEEDFNLIKNYVEDEYTEHLG